MDAPNVSPIEPEQVTAPEAPGRRSIIGLLQRRRGRQLLVGRGAYAIFGKDGVAAIRKQNWSFTGVLLAFLGIVADLTQLLGPISKWGLALSATAAVAFGVVIFRKMKARRACAVPFLSSFVFMLMFGTLAVAQGAFSATERGLLAKTFPMASDIQLAMFGKLANIEVVVEETKEIASATLGTTKDVLAVTSSIAQALDSARLTDTERAALEAEIKTLKTSLGEKGAVLDTILNAAVAQGTAPEKLTEALKAGIARYEELLAALSRPTNMPYEFEAARENALALVKAGDLDGAEQAYIDLRAAIRAHREQTQRDEAAAVAGQAAVAAVTDLYRAGKLYAEAAALLPVGEDALYTDYMFRTGYAAYTYDKTRGDNGALRAAVKWYRACLDRQSRDRSPLDWAMTQNNLGTALQTLGQRGDDQALADAITAFREALKEYTRDRSPLDWAMTTENMVLIRMTEADRLGDRAAAKAVFAALLDDLDEVLAEYHRAKSTYDVERCNRLRAALHARLEA